MKNLQCILTASLGLLISSLGYSAQPPQTIGIKGIKGVIAKIPFTDQTTITQLKQALQTEEGIPVNQQGLYRQEKGSFLGFQFNSRVVTVLEDAKTCLDYDLKADEEIRLMLKIVKSPAEIEAELKARRERIAEVLTQDVLLKELLPTIFAYDTCSE